MFFPAATTEKKKTTDMRHASVGRALFIGCLADLRATTEEEKGDRHATRRSTRIGRWRHKDRRKID